MPVYLRNFYVRQLVKIKKEEKAEMDKANKKPSGLARPGIKQG